MAEEITMVAVIGMGALGIMYADHFERHMEAGSVTVIADGGRIARYRAAGPSCNGRACGFGYSTPEDYPGKAGLILIAVKAAALDAAIELARPVTGPDTVIVSVLNGITSEEIIERKLGTGTVIHSVAQAMDAVREGVSVNTHSVGVLCCGIPAGEEEKRPALVRLTRFFDRVQLPYILEKDVMHRMYAKWMFNTGFNQVIAVEAGVNRAVQRPGHARETFLAAMREALAVARAEGVDLTEEDIRSYAEIGDALPPDGMPSMRQDTLAGRPTEVELFSGTVIRKAEKFGIDVPVNRMLYRRLKKIEAGR